MRNGYGHMVVDDYVRQVREIHRERAARLKEVRSRKQAIKYQDRVKEAIDLAFSPIPPKTPLNARVTGTLERKAYRVEKVLFESRPGVPVTGNLYVPANLKQPAPGVVAPCGHSQNGKAYPRYQEFCQRLVQAGFVTLIYDPFNQGERDQYYRLPAETAVRNNCCQAHNLMGKQLELLGEFFGMWRAWDGIRAFDYLITRPEVDPERICLTGNSGGGTLSTWLWAIEDRFLAAAPNCFITTFLSNLENELPADSEQYPPGVLAAGLEEADFLLARTPKPLILLGEKYDFFDLRGWQEADAELRRFHALFSAEKDYRTFLGNHGHGYYPESQQAMVKFFCAKCRLPYRGDAPIQLEKDEDLNVTPQGQVIPDGAVPIYEIAKRQAGTLDARRKRHSPATLRKKLANLLTVSTCEVEMAPYYRNLRGQEVPPDTFAARYAVETEDDIRTIIREFPGSHDRGSVLSVGRSVTVYLPHLSGEIDLKNDSLAGRLTAQGPVHFIDVRGLGESMPDENYGDFFQAYGMDYLAHGHGLMLNRSYFGRRLHDALRTLDLFAAQGTKEITLIGRGQGALLALCAAVFHKKVRRVILKNGPITCRAWLETPLVTWPAANFIRGLLPVCDLPDLMRLLGDKITLVEPWGPDMQPLPPEALADELRRSGLPENMVRKEEEIT